ncbi:MAG TPA: hypothetical protein VGW35_11595 [Methylomirabilota bacterium]|nr:hypothetical protein [Methylomirabilota bacterium]
MKTGPRRPNRRLGALTALVLLASSCASVPERRPPVLGGVAAGEAAELVRRWEREWQAFSGLRAAVDLTVVRQGRAQRSAGALLVSPTRLRFEAISPLGLPALIVTTGPESLTIYSPTERKAWRARPTPESMNRWLGVPVRPETLIRLLAGHVPTPPPGVAVRVAEDRGAHIVFEADGARQRVWVTAEGQPARLQLENGERLTVTFERALGGGLQELVVEAPGRSLEAHLRYVSGENMAPPPDAFELPIPPGVPIEAVD